MCVPEDTLKKILALIRQGLLESACELLKKDGHTLDTPTLTGAIENCLQRAETEKSAGNVRASILYRRRAAALIRLMHEGRLTGAVIPVVVMPEGYRGKIMLAWLEGDRIPGRTFLRSGDDWHREILRSFEQEVRDYGFENFQITPKGGAFAECRTDGAIRLFGASEEFGPCRMEDAVRLVRSTFSDQNVFGSDMAGR